MQLIKFKSLYDSENRRIAKMTSYKVGYSKLWSTDSGRSITGAYKGTLMGIFPKLTITVGAQNDADRALLLKIVNSQFQDVTYYDTEYRSFVTKTFYFGDVEDEVKKAVGESKDDIRHAPIQFSVVATTRRSANDKV